MHVLEHLKNTQIQLLEDIQACFTSGGNIIRKGTILTYEGTCGQWEYYKCEIGSIIIRGWSCPNRKLVKFI